MGCGCGCDERGISGGLFPDGKWRYGGRDFYPKSFSGDLPRQINTTKSTPSITQLKLIGEHYYTERTCLIFSSRAPQGILDKPLRANSQQ
jgi:hypothetical protein